MTELEKILDSIWREQELIELELQKLSHTPLPATYLVDVGFDRRRALTHRTIFLTGQKQKLSKYSTSAYENHKPRINWNFKPKE